MSNDIKLCELCQLPSLYLEQALIRCSHTDSLICKNDVKYICIHCQYKNKCMMLDEHKFKRYKCEYCDEETCDNNMSNNGCQFVNCKNRKFKRIHKLVEVQIYSICCQCPKLTSTYACCECAFYVDLCPRIGKIYQVIESNIIVSDLTNIIVDYLTKISDEYRNPKINVKRMMRGEKHNKCINVHCGNYTCKKHLRGLNKTDAKRCINHRAILED